MPYRKRYYGRRKRIYRRKVSRAVKRYVKRMFTVQEEPKVYTTPPTVVNLVGSTGAAQLVRLSGVPQGTADSQRVGDEIKLKKLELFLQYSIASTSRDTMFRAILFRWKQVDNVGVSPVTGDVCGGILNAYSHDNRSIVKVLYDSGVRHISDTGNRGLDIHKWINLRQSRIDFQLAGTSGTNHIYLWLACQDGQGIAGNQNVTYSAQLTYTDA